MNTAQTSELKREEYHRYLEKSGVIDQLTKVLVGLYELPQKPVDASNFVKEFMGVPLDEENLELQKTIAEQARVIKNQEEKIASLEKELAELKKSD